LIGDSCAKSVVEAPCGKDQATHGFEHQLVGVSGLRGNVPAGQHAEAAQRMDFKHCGSALGRREHRAAAQLHSAAPQGYWARTARRRETLQWQGTCYSVQEVSCILRRTAR